MKKLTIVVIGLGRQMMKDHVPAILRRNDLEIVAVVDKDKELARAVGEQLNVSFFTGTLEAIQEKSPDLALVSVPHNAYYEILEILAKHHIATLKEKPLAMTHSEGKKITKLFQDNATYLQVCVQRRFSQLYDSVLRFTQSIGDIYSIYVEYALSLSAEDMKTGWRADRSVSGGGAAIDMGYHVIDLLTYILGFPDKVYAQLNYNSVGDGYTIEDTMKALMTFNERVNADVVVTKVSSQKNEKIRIIGDKGSIHIDGRTVSLFDNDKNEVETYTYASKDDEVDRQLEFFVESYKNRATAKDEKNRLLFDQELNMLIIDAIYESAKEERVVRLSKELR